MKIGNIDINNVKLGNIQVKKVLWGDTLVWNYFDLDYQAILDYAITQGYTLPSESQQLLQNQLIVDLKNSGVWDKLDTFSVFATDGDSDFALIDWKRLTQYTAVNSPTFTANQGFTTNGTSSTILSNFNPSVGGFNYTLNDASYGVYKFSGSGNRGVRSVGLVRSSINFTSTGGGNVGVNTSTLYNWTNVFTINNNFKSIHRTSSSLTSAYENGIFTESNTLSSLSLPTDFEIGRDPFVFSSWECSIFYAGASMLTEIADFNTAINNYMSSL